MAWTTITKDTETWTNLSKVTDSGETGAGFLTSPGFMAQGFLSGPTGSSWTKQTKDTETWNTLAKVT